MFWIVGILASGLLTALAGFQIGGVPAALFMGSIGTLVGCAARDISKHRHAILALTLIAAVTGFWFGGYPWAVIAGLLGFFLLLALHDHIQKHDAQLPVGLAVMLVCGLLGWHFSSGVEASRGAVATVISLIGFITWVGIYDHYLQRIHAIRRNFPIIGWCRYGFELIGDELRQYWFMGNLEEWPYNRKRRRKLYKSGKGVNDNLGFGTEENYRAVGKLHLLPAAFPKRDRTFGNTLPQLVFGKGRRKIPYTCRWPIGISGMSWGALSEEAVRALSSGGKLAKIHMATGEGGLTPYHLDGVIRRVSFWRWAKYWLQLGTHYATFGFAKKPVEPKGEVVGGALIIVQIGPAKFGFKRFFTDPFTGPEGRGFRKRYSNEFDWEKLVEVMKNPQCVMIELKAPTGQGAKPGQGGKLPKEKITPELAEFRGIPMGVDCYSPNAWDEFDSAATLVEFGEKIAEATGKPWGIKTAVGFVPKQGQKIASLTVDFWRQLAKVMKDTGKGPDYICIDGGEGGTGAAPVVLADTVGLPLLHSIPLVDNVLREFEVRDRVVLVGSGQLASGDDIMIAIALGLDMVHIARAFLIGGLGCIMALRCHTNRCPVGITTQDPRLRRGLDPEDKYVRTGNLAMVLQRELIMLCKSLGVNHPWELTRDHVSVVSAPMVSTLLSELYPYPDDGHRSPELAPAPESEPEHHDDRGPKLIKLGIISRAVTGHR